jgi:hypothetical protein
MANSDNQPQKVRTRQNKKKIMKIKKISIITKVTLKNTKRLVRVSYLSDKTSWCQFSKNLATLSSTEAEASSGSRW